MLMDIVVTNSQRLEIILYHVSAAISNHALTSWTNQKFGTSMSEMTISRLLKNESLY